MKPSELLAKVREYLDSKTVKRLGEECIFEVNGFAHGGIRLDLRTKEFGEPMSTCNKWIPGLAADEIALKNTEENEGIYDLLVDAKVIHRYHRLERTGYIKLLVCKLRLNEEDV